MLTSSDTNAPEGGISADNAGRLSINCRLPAGVILIAQREQTPVPTGLDRYRIGFVVDNRGSATRRRTVDSVVDIHRVQQILLARSDLGANGIIVRFNHQRFGNPGARESILTLIVNVVACNPDELEIRLIVGLV